MRSLTASEIDEVAAGKITVKVEVKGNCKHTTTTDTNTGQSSTTISCTASASLTISK